MPIEAGADLLCLGLDPDLYTESYDALNQAVAAGRLTDRAARGVRGAHVGARGSGPGPANGGRR